jgi:L-threonylcarbamoyladenylate synthase
LFIGDINDLIKVNAGKKIAVIGFGELNLPGDVIAFNLSQKKSLQEAAINLFKYLRMADDSQAEIVLAGLLPSEGLGRAINDRLKRAAV